MRCIELSAVICCHVSESCMRSLIADTRMQVTAKQTVTETRYATAEVSSRISTERCSNCLIGTFDLFEQCVRAHSRHRDLA